MASAACGCPAPMLLHCCGCPALMLLHCCGCPAPMLLHCCGCPAPMLLRNAASHSPVRLSAPHPPLAIPTTSCAADDQRGTTVLTVILAAVFILAYVLSMVFMF